MFQCCHIFILCISLKNIWLSYFYYFYNMKLFWVSLYIYLYKRALYFHVLTLEQLVPLCFSYKKYLYLFFFFKTIPIVTNFFSFCGLTYPLFPLQFWKNKFFFQDFECSKSLPVGLQSFCWKIYELSLVCNTLVFSCCFKIIPLLLSLTL